MAPNGTSRKTPGSAANNKSSSSTFISQSLVDEIFSESGKSKPPRIRDELKEMQPKSSKPGDWDSDVVGGKDKDAGRTSPLVNSLDPDVGKAFTTARPMHDKPEVVKCGHCRRPILKHRAKLHVEECLAKKQEKQRRKKEAKDARDAAARKDRERENGVSESEEEDVIGGSKTARKTDFGDGEGASKGKKRKAEDDAGGKKKKKKDDPKAKAPRPKAPVDVEKQCGVELPQGGQCARSLTCKSHSMGAKRAVPGRSAPYDKLLAEYQRKNQAKLQKAALESQPVLPEDNLDPTGPIDSDEEKDFVLAALTRARPHPIYHPTIVPLRKKYQAVRLREMLSNALAGRGGGGLFALAPG